ncbi:hypothetical protein [Rhizobium lentis]|uniref:CDP-alcohol phosphatidyltransferase family protein n=1 Tax=Rhizobium lentis TaxID=1138194 RepID=A0ABS7IB64_9HYPH|nr:hypothetical protein [Rhizobium lentis]MBX5087707.1 hypothetical protein [Rhizobium lentis]MBX5101635.1 hypothetical protein [Rhizobium lentis]
MGEEEDASGRPIASRSSSWATGMSAWVARTGVTPNSISLFSILFAGIGAALILLTTQTIAMIGAAVSMQLRLACNLLDGLAAQAIETLASRSHWSLLITSVTIAAGSLVTCITRTINLSRSLERS